MCRFRTWAARSCAFSKLWRLSKHLLRLHTHAPVGYFVSSLASIEPPNFPRTMDNIGISPLNHKKTIKKYFPIRRIINSIRKNNKYQPFAWAVITAARQVACLFSPSTFAESRFPFPTFSWEACRNRCSSRRHWKSPTDCSGCTCPRRLGKTPGELLLTCQHSFS